MANFVVAHYQDGRVLKGITLDLDPSRPKFHVRPAQGLAQEIELAELKAVFYVRSLEGDPARQERLQVVGEDARARGSTLVSVRFLDGEVIVGYTIRYPPNRPFFYVLPVDPESNNIRVLVVQTAVESMESPPALVLTS